MIYPDFFLDLIGLFFGEALNPILANKMQDKNKEVTANPKFQTLKKTGFSKTQNPKA